MSSLIPWYEREVGRLRGELDRMFEEYSTLNPFRYFFREGDWVPAIDVSESDSEIVVYAEVPGMEADEIDISIAGRVLTIKGETQQKHEEKEKNYHRIERRHGSFSRSLELPGDVVAKDVKAKYKNGVLKLNLPKTEKQAQKKIEVKGS
jgi:HSP20 family protein